VQHAGAEIGYVFNPSSGGRGYATEAVAMMLRLGFEEFGLHRIVARIDERNEPPVKLAPRVGIRQEGASSRMSFLRASGVLSLISRY